MRKVDKYGDYAELNKAYVVRNRMFCALISKHKRGVLDDDAYFNAIVKLSTHYELDLPAEMQKELLEN